MFCAYFRHLAQSVCNVTFHWDTRFIMGDSASPVSWKPNVCIGTDKGFSEQFYLDRPRTSGNLHGQAPILWTASALLR